jgi:hypothetical protein
MNRLEDAADEIVHTLCKISARMMLNSDYGPNQIADAVLWAYKEIGDIDDEEALEAAAEAKYNGHDPETRA